MLLDPSAATALLLPRQSGLWLEKPPKVCHARRTAQGYEHCRQDRGGVEKPVQPVTDGDRHHKGRNQLHAHPRANSPWGTTEPTLVSQGLPRRGVETLLAS